MTYAEARRAARKLLGDHAELELMSKAPVGCYRYQIGVRTNGVLVLAGAGNSWSEAVQDATKRFTDPAIQMSDLSSKKNT